MAWVKGDPDINSIEAWRKGLLLEGRMTIPAKVKLIESIKSKSLLKIMIKEGRNRQIRKVGDLLGHPIIDLKRIAIGHIKLGKLKEGQWRFLDKEEWEPFISEKNHMEKRHEV